MFKSLTVKWIITLIFTSLVGIILIAVFVNAVISREFDRLLVGQAQEMLVSAAARYYAENGSFEGIEDLFGARDEPNGYPQQGANYGSSRGDSDSPPLRPYGGGNPPNRMPAPGLVLVSMDGIVLMKAGHYNAGDIFNMYDVIDQQAVMVDDVQVATVYFTGGSPELNARQQVYIEATNTAILIGAVSAVGVSALVAVLLSGSFLRPLRALTHAVKAMHAGQLEQRVEVRSKDELGALAAAFNEMSAQVARANHLRKQMTADIAHDLRSPLTVITGYLEGLRDGTLKPTPTRFDTMYGEATQLSRLIDDLRTLSLADAGELRLMRKPVNPHDLLEGTVASFKPAADARGIMLASDAPPNLPTVTLDHDRMNQVLANLVGNALRYARSRITLKAAAGVNELRLIIEDDGEGIPPDKLPFVFERFYRADESRHASSGESGLGLAIARSIVEAHGGTIRASSTVGQGTAIIVNMPF